MKIQVDKVTEFRPGRRVLKFFEKNFLNGKKHAKNGLNGKILKLN